MGESEGHTKKDRSRVERVFGFMERTMSGLEFHGVGKVRTDADIALTYIIYNDMQTGEINEYSRAQRANHTVFALCRGEKTSVAKKRIKFNISVIKTMSIYYPHPVRIFNIFVVK